MSYKEVCHNKKYIQILLANLVNRLGDSIETIAFTWLVYAFTEEGSWAAIVFAVNKIPAVICLPFAGAYIEKKNKQKVIVICDIIRVSIISFLLVCIIKQQLSIAILIGTTLLVSLAEAFRIPAGISLITQILNNEELSYGVSLNVVVSMIAGIIGTGIGGILLAKGGMYLTFAIDISTFLISILFVVLIKHKETIMDNVKEMNSWTIFKAGLRYIVGKKTLLFIFWEAVFANTIMAPIDSLQAFIVVEVFGRDSGYLSVLNICLTLGILLGGIIFPRIENHFKDKKIWIISCIYILFMYVYIAYMNHFSVNALGIWSVRVIVSYFIYGLFAGFLSTGLGLALMKNTEQQYMARVNTIYNSVADAVIPLFSVVTGVLMSFWEINIVFMLMVSIFCILLIFGIICCKIDVK